jgi:hypothetical protein
MVLKVVRGKILETLELAGSPAACGSVLELPAGGVAIRIVKEHDYLADNIRV